METYHGTTIISVRRKTPNGYSVAIGGDGQVTLGNIIVKGTARKVRKLHHGKVLAGFAGATADAFTLFERFEAKLEKHQGHLARAAIELTKDWRTDRVLRRLAAPMRRRRQWLCSTIPSYRPRTSSGVLSKLQASCVSTPICSIRSKSCDTWPFCPFPR